MSTLLMFYLCTCIGFGLFCSLMTFEESVDSVSSELVIRMIVAFLLGSILFPITLPIAVHRVITNKTLI